MARNRPGSHHISSGAGDLASTFGSLQKGIFRKNGAYWTVGYNRQSVRLKDARGLGYIAHLLRYPNTEFHVLDLYGGLVSRDDDGRAAGQWQNGPPLADQDFEQAGVHIANPSDAGEMLDQEAKVAYRHRLAELRQELDEAKKLEKVERAAEAEAEMDALMRELSRAVGLGGRDRRAVSPAERARQSITKSIKSALERIAQAEAVLGNLLWRCIKTGTFCSYRPDPNFPLEWEFAETVIKLAEPIGSSEDRITGHAIRSGLPPVLADVPLFSTAERTAFVGREAERGAIRSIIDVAVGGRGSLAVLGGGPGVGKSRLAMEMADYASRLGFECVVGHCYERDEHFPYLPFAELIESSLAQAASLEEFRGRLGENAAELAQLAPSLRRIFPDIPEPLELPAAQKRMYLFRSISEALARSARTRAYLCILEDLHWAHESTLALLVHLANRIGQLPVVIIGTYRDGFSDRSPVLNRTLEELIRLGIRPLKLRGLPKEAVGQMLTALCKHPVPANLVSVISDATQGNPFFVEELYRHLHEEGKVFDPAGEFRTDITIDDIDVPENVRLIIGRRLERFDESEKLALSAAAVIGRSFSFQLLTEISRIELDGLFSVIEKAQQIGIIVPSAEGPERPFTFSHELVRQTLLSDISGPRQQLLHANVADAIERLYSNALNERAGDISDHLIKAGPFADRRRLLHYLTIAGKVALRAAAFEEAERSLRRALSHLAESDLRERADLLASLAIAGRGLERWDEAFANLTEALEFYIELGDRRMIARSCTQLIGIFIWAGRLKDAINTAHRGLSYLATDVSTERTQLLAALGQAQSAAGCWEPADEALEEARNLASALSDSKLAARVRGSRLTVNYQFLRLREAAEDGEKSYGSGARPWERAIELRYLYQTFLCLGRLDDAAKVRNELEILATKIGDSYSIMRCLVAQAWLDFGKKPDLVHLEATLRRVLLSHPKGSYTFRDVFSEIQLSIIDSLGGNLPTALSHARVACGLEAETSIQGVGVGTLFRQMAYASDKEGALAILHEKWAWLPRGNRASTLGAWWMLALVIEGLVMLSERKLAAELYPLALELLDTGVIALWQIWRFPHTVAGLAAGAARDWNAAEDYFQTALRQTEAIPHLLERTEIRRFYGMMLMDRAASGDREKARALLNDALGSYRRIGMPRHIEATLAQLDKLTTE
jgi:hypothetical protein